MDAVTIDDVKRVARKYLVPAKVHLAVVGPYRTDKRFAPLLPG
jgi:predicted Zn-dependent peptidase